MKQNLKLNLRERKKQERGITLVALVVTIVVLLILAGITIVTLTGDNGILKQAKNAGTMTEHANITEHLQLEINSYTIEKNTNVNPITLVGYLQSKGIIGDEVGEGSGKYKINVEKLTGKTQKYGNGTATESEKKDVYMLERVNTSTGNLINKKVASTTPIKIAATTNSTVKYKIVYYGITSETLEVGDLINTKEIVESANLITFTIRGIEYQTEEGMTWREWCESDYNTGGYYVNANQIWGNAGTRVNDGTMHNFVDPESTIEKNREYGSQGVTECVYPNSNILISTDGKTALAKDIKESDEIVYFDFNENVIKTGKVSKVYIHKDATNFVRYKFSDGTYLEATDYHPIYTKEGWKSQTKRNGYELPKIGDEVKTPTEWKTITNIEEWQGLEDCYDFAITTEEGTTINNYYANGTLVQGSY